MEFSSSGKCFWTTYTRKKTNHSLRSQVDAATTNFDHHPWFESFTNYPDALNWLYNTSIRHRLLNVPPACYPELPPRHLFAAHDPNEPPYRAPAYSPWITPSDGPNTNPPSVLSPQLSPPPSALSPRPTNPKPPPTVSRTRVNTLARSAGPPPVRSDDQTSFNGCDPADDESFNVSNLSLCEDSGDVVCAADTDYDELNKPWLPPQEDLPAITPRASRTVTSSSTPQRGPVNQAGSHKATRSGPRHYEDPSLMLKLSRAHKDPVLFSRLRNVRGECSSILFSGDEEVPPPHMAMNYPNWNETSNLLSLFLQATYTTEAHYAITSALIADESLEYDGRMKSLVNLGITISEANFILCMIRTASFIKLAAHHQY